MSGGRRVGTGVLLVAVVLLTSFALGPAASSSAGTAQLAGEVERSQASVLTVSPHPNTTHEIWPYTSRRKSFDSATLPINMVVLEDPSIVRIVLMVGPNAEWKNQSRGLNGSGRPEGDNEGGLVPVRVNGSSLHWAEARGSNRYAYVQTDAPGSGRWLEESYQLHDGDYFGTRYHIRFYGVEESETTWTALQAHHEHWDWFRLRHTVGSLPRAQHYVEKQFYDQWYVTDVQRRRFTGGGILNSDGWATVVDFGTSSSLLLPFLRALSVTLLGGLAIVGSVSHWLWPDYRRRLRSVFDDPPVDARFSLLALSIAALPLLARLGSLTVERAALVNSPKAIAATFYPILALGIPLAAFVLARDLEPEEAFVGALAGLGVGLLFDYAYLGISVLPIEVIVHRVLLLIAVGFVAAGGAGRAHDSPTWRRTLLLGGGLWVVGLLWPLFLM